MVHAVCLQHVTFEGPGAVATALEKRGVPLACCLVPEDGLPAELPDLLVVMGGPMSVNDPDPWIAQEIEFIRSALHAGRPVLGICLGSQLMAKALGAQVGPARTWEIGMTRIQLTELGKEDPVFQALPDTFEVFEWHGEVFTLPPGAVCLAGSAVAPIQAFRYGPKAYGLLFHVEVEPNGIEALCRACAADLVRAGLTAEAVKARAMPALTSLHQVADRLVAQLLKSGSLEPPGEGGRWGIGRRAAQAPCPD
jgi:GMP synthase-like glutamine amidotransferase